MAVPVLKMNGISKAFNGIKVLQDVSFELIHCEVHALMGGNGAGKSTLMNILTGVYEMDAGQITIDERKARILSPLDAERHGVSMIFQEFNLIPTLTVAGNYPRDGCGIGKRINSKTMHRLSQSSVLFYLLREYTSVYEGWIENILFKLIYIFIKGKRRGNTAIFLEIIIRIFIQLRLMCPKRE